MIVISATDALGKGISLSTRCGVYKWSVYTRDAKKLASKHLHTSSCDRAARVCGDRIPKSEEQQEGPMSNTPRPIMIHCSGITALQSQQGKIFRWCSYQASISRGNLVQGWDCQESCIPIRPQVLPHQQLTKNKPSNQARAQLHHTSQ
jgi:hypothetical protein